MGVNMHAADNDLRPVGWMLALQFRRTDGRTDGDDCYSERANNESVASRR